MAYTEQDRRNHIRELQQYLYSLSFLDETLPRVIPDGIYGRQTALAVRAFQQKNGLRPNGETNRATWDAIVNAYRQQIQREATPLHLYTPERELLGAGETGLLVLVLQSILKTLGVRYTNIQNLQITGIYDAPTQKAVQNFQSLTARKPTGMVDRATWNLLVAAAECSSLFEEIVYLLLMGELPTADELDVMRKSLAMRRELPPGFLVDSIMQAPSKNIMNKLARSILSLYSYDDDPEHPSLEGEMRIALGLIAKMPILMDGAYQAKRHKFDNASMIIHQIRPEEGTAESILSLIRNDRNYTKEEAQLLDIMLSIHAEHGGGNNSTFACRVATSSGTDPYAAYTTAINSLKGSRHGGANIKVVQMLDCIKENVKNWGNRGEVADFITKILKKEAGDGSGLIYGMGHAVYTLSDPRAVILKRKAFEMAKGKEIEAEFQLLSLIEELTPILMKEVRGVDKAMCANVDMYSGLVYRMLGIPDELFTPLFASARMVGWAAHRMEELLTGKRIIRPAYKPITKVKPYIPLCDRKD